MRNYYLDIAEEKKAQEKLDEANRELIQEAIKAIEGLPMWSENNNTWTVNSNHHYSNHHCFDTQDEVCIKRWKRLETMTSGGYWLAKTPEEAGLWERSLAPFDFNSKEKFRGDLTW